MRADHLAHWRRGLMTAGRRSVNVVAHIATYRGLARQGLFILPPQPRVLVLLSLAARSAPSMQHIGLPMMDPRYFAAMGAMLVVACVATLAEAGVPAYDASAWQMIVAPA